MNLATRRAEREIQREVLRALRLMPGVTVFRLNVGAMRGEYTPKGADELTAARRWFVQFGVRGMSDLLGWKSIRCPAGEPHRADCAACGGRGRLAVLLAVEVKRPGQKVTPEQEAFLAGVRQAGGIALVARSVDDVLRERRLAEVA